jgi:ATP-dependent Clp protease ATP-binding subunit ClpA
MMTRSQTRIAELEARIAELEKENAKLKKETKEYEAVKELYQQLYDEDLSCDIFNDPDKLKERLRETKETKKEMTPEELQIDFWDNMGEMWGYDIIGSESHPLKKAFELYCEMKKERMKEDEDEALTKEETKALGESLFAQIKALDVTADSRHYMLWTEDDIKSEVIGIECFPSSDIWCIEDLRSDLFIIQTKKDNK